MNLRFLNLCKHVLAVYRVPSQLNFYLLTASYMLGYVVIHGGPFSTCFINSPHQYTPLHLAVWQGHEDTVRYLVEQGADTKIKDKHGVSK